MARTRTYTSGSHSSVGSRGSSDLAAASQHEDASLIFGDEDKDSDFSEFVNFPNVAGIILLFIGVLFGFFTPFGIAPGVLTAAGLTLPWLGAMYILFTTIQSPNKKNTSAKPKPPPLNTPPPRPHSAAPRQGTVYTRPTQTPSYRTKRPSAPRHRTYSVSVEEPKVPEKKLRKAPEYKRKIFGVCGGLAEYMGVNANTLRALSVLLSVLIPVTFGVPIAVYLILAFLMDD